MAAKNVLITGANTGIGYQIVRALCQSSTPYNILVAGRTPSKVQDAIAAVQKEFPSTKSKLHAISIDLDSDDSIRAASEAVSQRVPHLDALVNNAGTQLDQGYWQGKMTERDLWNRSWDTNVAGTQVLTTALIPLLLRSSDPRMIFLTSGIGTLAGADNLKIPVNKPAPAGWPKKGPALSAYRAAKAATNMQMLEWHRMLREDGVKVWSVSPGMLATNLGHGDPEVMRKMGAQDPSVAGEFITAVLEGLRDHDVGKVIMRDNVIQPW